MPSPIEPLLHPARRRPPPEPVHVSLRPVFLVGTAAWLVGLVPTTILWAGDHAPATAIWICAVGAALGGLGLVWPRLRPTSAVADRGTATPRPTDLS